jgi:spore coat protein H
MKNTIFLFCLIIFICFQFANAQNAVFPNAGTLYDGKLHKVELRMNPDSLEALLNDSNRWTDHSYPATFIYDDIDTVKNVGVRMKGNTSRNSEKLSFKIDVDEFANQAYQGLKTFNLNGSHNDPSISREFLCALIMNADSNISYRANDVQLYLNGALRGIYSNAEQVNKKFLDSRFGENSGNLYKCSWPAELSWLGSDQQTYKDIINPSPLNERAYELKTNESDDDYSDLVTLINVINNTPANNFKNAIDTIFEVEAYLRTLAAEVLIGHWDNYFYNKNNYYLYHKTNGKFVYMPYDMDNTLGVQWGVSDINVRDIYNWGNKQTSKSPLTYKILAVPEYKAMYENALRELCSTVYNETYLFPIIDTLRNRLAPAVAIDPFFNNEVPTDYGYTTTQWAQSYTQAIDDHATFGIKPFITSRRNSALEQLPPVTALKELNNIQFALYPNPSQGVWQLTTNNDAHAIVFDAMGKMQFTQHISAGMNIFEQKLANGIYFIQLQTQDGIATQKIIIE